MFVVKVSKECGCFKKSDLENDISFTSKDDALIKAHNMAHTMNQDFCGKHDFEVFENGDEFLINVEEAHSGGCCGGGCHS